MRWTTLVTALCLAAGLVFAACCPVRGAAVPAGGLAIDFNDVDIRVFIKYVSQVTGRNFVVDKNVKGKISVFSATPVSSAEAYEVFQSVLDVYGYAAVDAGPVVKIVPRTEAAARGVDVSTGKEGGETMVTRILRLEHADAGQVRGLLSPLVPKGAVVTAYPAAGLLLITDTAANVQRLSAIVGQVDVPGADRRLSVVELENASAAVVARTLERVFAAGTGKNQKKADRPVIVPYEQANMLVLLASRQEEERITELVRKLDRQPATDQGNIHVYYLQYASAEDLAKVLTALPNSGQKGAKQPSRVQTFARDVRIVADKATNALVITADPSDYQVLEGVIRDLDIPRRMVYIEALIMEVNTEKDFTLGVEWLGAGKTDVETKKGGLFGGFSGTSASNGTTYDLLGGLAQVTDSAGNVVQRSNLPAGFAMGVYTEAITVGTGNTVVTFPSLGALLQAYKKDSDVHILSTPQILTTDNQEARIQVGENVPYLTKEATGDQNYQTYEYRDVGVTLRITPQINQDGLVRLKIFQEVIKLKGGAEVFRPATLKRVAETTVIVRDGATVVIGGIIGDDSSESRVKVPLLGDIPVIGNLFSATTTTGNRTNLYVFITPRVIGNPAAATGRPGAGPPAAGAAPSGLAVPLGKGRPFSVVALLLGQGDASLAAGDLTTAASYYEKALLLEADNPYALINLGVIAERRGQRQQAMDYYRRAVVAPAAGATQVATVPEHEGWSLADLARANLTALLDRPPAAGPPPVPPSPATSSAVRP